MTRDSIPRDDLYGELEVSRQASVAAIEAAYRRLVKQHHPDVARSDDVERIKRLNLAREWLTDLDRRRRYDVSRGLSPTSSLSHLSANGDDAPSGTRRRPGPRSADAAGAAADASSEPERSFGVNANEVRTFLAGLRGLDNARARRVFDGRAVAHANGYTAARRVAVQIAQAKRKTEWQLAREAASVIARGKLGDTTLTEQVVDVLADAAGAIAIRDLLASADYKTLMLPWTWRAARVERVKAAVPAAQRSSTVAASTVAAPPTEVPTRSALDGASIAPPVAVVTAATRATSPSASGPSISSLGQSRWRRPEGPPGRIPAPSVGGVGRPSLSAPIVSLPKVSIPNVSIPAWTPPTVLVRRGLPGLVAFALSSIATAALLGVFAPTPEQRVAGVTDAPTSDTSGATPPVVAPPTSIAVATAEPGASDPAGETPDPGPTEAPGGPGGGATEPPEPTEPAQTPKPTRPPTPAPTHPPTPTPTPPPPTPTPEGQCIVPNLIGERASTAAATWSDAGFSGSVTIDPPMQPNQRIGFQSLAAGSSEPCSSGITVSKVA